MHKFMFYAIVVLHFILVSMFVISFCILPFLQPWYVAFPIMVFQVFFVTNRLKCILTEAENYYRKKLGKPTIKGFVGHYIHMPIRRIRRRFTKDYRNISTSKCD